MNFLAAQSFDSALSRFFAGLVLSTLIALAARSTRTLSWSGVIAAVAVATACSTAGWSWAWILIAFFVTSTALSKISENTKRQRTSDVVEKGGERDAWQVFANGGVFGVLATLTLIWPERALMLAAAGAIASSTADTWSTEMGTLSRNLPRSILSMKRVAAGTSGGVTLLGTIAQIGGALFIAGIVSFFDWPSRSATAAIAGGIGGSLVDSLLGATVQEKRWCEHCHRGTERAVHTCGNATVHSSGFIWLGNDIVNFISSIAGALLGLACLT